MPDLPSGTVTFLFTDIEGSTGLLHQLGDDYADALAEHRRVVRDAFATHDGFEVDTQGDAFFGAFARASAAVDAAREIQRELASGPIRVRIGLHTGEPLLTDEGYVGLDVHRGARICAAGHGGQVLLSQSSREVSGVDAHDLGEHRLKDLLEPQRLFQLGEEEFPPLKTLDWTNLPVQPTPLVGRDRELSEVVALLREHQLLTLVGAPGTGKTRLALQVAADLADEFEHVWWVGLQELRHAELVEPTIAQTVGAKGDLAGYLRDRRALLLLDNLEHVLDCVPRLADLIAGAAGLKLVATSREPLRLTVEQQYPVPPLPDDDAMILFTERARAVKPDFAANGAVAEICRRLDGLPLAIELAAARVKLLSPDALLDRIEQRLPLLTGGARDLPERQQTLRATIEWSYELLEPYEQELLARLSVFAGGWMLEAAEAVCDCDLDTLASLVDKSLVREQGGRFSMLETIREFARERLTDTEARRRHAAYFLAGAEENSPRRFGALARDQSDWFERELDNLRAALDSLEEQEDPELEVRLAIACQRFWVQLGLWTEGRQRIEAAVARAGGASPALRERALSNAAEFAWRHGDYARGKALAEKALALLAEASMTGRRPLGADVSLGICEAKLGNEQRAVEVFELAAKIAREDGREDAVAAILNNLGNLALSAHDYTRARAHFEESAAMDRQRGEMVPLANNLVDLGFVALAEDRVDDAADAFGESLAISRNERLTDLIWALEGLAAVALERGAPVEAARLLAATARPRAQLGFAADYYPIGEEMRERTLEAARAKLGEAEFATSQAEGEALSLAEAAEAAELV